MALYSLSPLKIAMPLIMILTLSFTAGYADTSVSTASQSIQEKLLSTHLQIKFLSLDVSTEQILEYLIIAVIPLIIIIIIASSARSKNKKQIRK